MKTGKEAIIFDRSNLLTLLVANWHIKVLNHEHIYPEVL